ncbi:MULTISPECIES: hypothetical protein [unclassified Arthrobacter]|uniref:hypothetical protein n=1 Tax=unclassified Arthrobacter TaxID=235627 RepID=UPI002E050DED|nr:MULTISPECIES: hypothetical protein [unclassified Arthrobacter]MEC5190872.1 hypothetical protein [Arthrobacter sp. MP_M4]MEC5202110.1 hypothetical protein [Arthrobacter sp. MP_M7]
MRPDPAAAYGPHTRTAGAELMFDSFRRWPLVPSAQLVRLRSALLQCVELASPGNGRDLSEPAGKLLQLVSDELDRRSGPSFPPAAAPLRARHARRPVGRAAVGRAHAGGMPAVSPSSAR